MKRLDIDILNSLGKKEGSVSELSERTGFCVSYVSERINALKGRGFLFKKREGKKVIVSLNPSFSIHLRRLTDRFDLGMLFSGKKDALLLHLLKPGSVGELEKETGLSQAQIYKDLRGLKQIGAVKEIEGRYSIHPEMDELVRMVEFLRDEELYRGVEEGVIVLWRKGDEILKKAPKGFKVDGVKTAFSRFSGSGVEYLPVNEYLYQPIKKLSLEEIFVHSLVTAETKTQLGMCVVFFLKNKGGLDIKKLKDFGRKFSVLDLYLDMISYLETGEGVRFPPWSEFMEKLNLYGIQVKKFDEDFLMGTLRLMGNVLSRDLDVYLIGGLNLMLRGVKDSTKDVDLVLKNRDDLHELKRGLERIGYREGLKAEGYNLFPSVVMERDGGPSFDLFVRVVCGGISFSEETRKFSEGKFCGFKISKGNFKMGKGAESFGRFNRLRVNLLSPEAIFIFKSMTEREGDLEDVRVLALKYPLDWGRVLSEIKRQEEISKKTFSFSLLDTLEVLEGRYGIHSPITKRLRFHCIKKGILLALSEPRTISELRKFVDFPRYVIENALRDLEKENRIMVDRGKKPYTVSAL